MTETPTTWPGRLAPSYSGTSDEVLRILDTAFARTQVVKHFKAERLIDEAEMGLRDAIDAARDARRSRACPSATGHSTPRLRSTRSACGPTPPPGYANSPGYCGPAGASLWVSQPRCPGATAATSAAAANELAGLLTEAGLEHLRTEMLDLDPPAVFVLGHVAPADDADLVARPRAHS